LLLCIIIDVEVTFFNKNFQVIENEGEISICVNAHKISTNNLITSSQYSTSHNVMISTVEDSADRANAAAG